MNDQNSNNTVSRRGFLSGLVTAGTTVVAGCGGKSNREKNPYNQDTGTPEPEHLDTNFQYHFTDAEGFNQVGGEIPENAEEHQIVESFVETSDKVDTWTEMLTNDHNKARLLLINDIEPGAGDEYEGTVEEIVQKTEELFQNWPENAEEFEEDYSSDIAGIEVTQIEEIEDKAEKFTMALRGASAIVTGHNNSAAANYLNTNLAEYTLQELDVEIPGYKVSTLWTAIDTVYEEPERPAGFDHPIGFLQYQDEEGNQKAKHFELENSNWIRHSANLENSVYTTPLGQHAPISPEYEANNFLSPLDYERGRELEERGELSENFDLTMLNSLLWMVDDAPEFYDYDEDTRSGAESQMPVGGKPNPVISNSFGESVQDYAEDPTTQKYRHLEGTSKAIFSAMAKQGWNEPIALDGTIEDPEVHHATEETIEGIHEDRAYDEVKDRVTAGQIL
ncbi:hypothetical protein GLT90_01590 [Nanohaloarchaea archaeon H12]|nr:hypothetical protein [Nanohaloarchaea archaeon H12]